MITRHSGHWALGHTRPSMVMGTGSLGTQLPRHSVAWAPGHRALSLPTDITFDMALQSITKPNATILALVTQI